MKRHKKTIMFIPPKRLPNKKHCELSSDLIGGKRETTPLFFFLTPPKNSFSSNASLFQKTMQKIFTTSISILYPQTTPTSYTIHNNQSQNIMR